MKRFGNCFINSKLIQQAFIILRTSNLQFYNIYMAYNYVAYNLYLKITYIIHYVFNYRTYNVSIQSYTTVKYAYESFIIYGLARISDFENNVTIIKSTAIDHGFNSSLIRVIIYVIFCLK